MGVFALQLVLEQRGKEESESEGKWKERKERKYSWSSYVFPFYIWRRIGRNRSLWLRLIERRKGARVFAIPFDFRAALGSDSSKNTWTRVSRAPESWNLASSRPTLIYFSSFAARRPLPLSTLRSVHGKTPARVTANMFLRSLKIVRSVCNTRRIMRHNASFFDSCTSLRETFDAT